MSALRTRSRPAIQPAKIGPKLRRWREDAGLSLEAAGVEISRWLQPVGSTVSSELVRYYETGDFGSRRLNPLFLLAAANVYGHSVDELGPGMAGVAEGVEAIVKTARAQRRSGKACFGDTVAA